MAGRGSVYRRARPDGTLAKTWTITYDRGPDPASGGRRQVSKGGFRTKKEAEEELTRRLREVDTGTDLDPTAMTTGEYLWHWHSSAAKGRLRLAAWERYERAIRLHLIPHLGTVPLAKLQPLHVSRLHAALAAAGYAPGTIQYAHAVLHGALDQALQWQMVPRNVAAAVRGPRVETVPGDVWDAATATRFLAALAGDRLEAFYHLAIATGMRRGELLALRWADVDLAGAVVEVRRNPVHTKAAGLIVQPPKTAAGRRRVDLPLPVVAVLRAHRARQNEERLKCGAEWVDRDLLFPNRRGDHRRPEGIDQHWYRVRTRIDAPAIPFHALRHSNATLLLKLGVHPKIVAE